MADASGLVAEALRARGEDIIGHDDLDLYIAEAAWSETTYQVGRRVDLLVQHGRISAARHEHTLPRTLSMLTRFLTVVSRAEYGAYEVEARDRIPQDLNDWPTVATAMALGIGIWTVDQDFFGCGVPVWTIETLLTHVEAGRARSTPLSL